MVTSNVLEIRLWHSQNLEPNQRVCLQPQKFGERKKLLNVAQTLMSINGG
jgi:hypothetical protein